MFLEAMTMTYAAEEIATGLVEILGRVKAGERVVISEEGEEVAELLPLQASVEDASLQDLIEQGIITPPGAPPLDFAPLAELPGTLAWFLENRS
jgi:antitoxin (DNA-binding transcriptional repressor) of toxin-antitoxin stability system